MKARITILLALVVLGALVPGLAHGERSQAGNLVVALNGGITPRSLPRDRAAPVAVNLQGQIRTDDGTSLPRVTSIELALEAKDMFFTRGLAVCPRPRLRNASSRQALDRCGGALVGSGWLDADVFVSGQSPFGIRARMLAFNGRTQGKRRAIWVNAFSSDPPVSLLLPFVVHPGSGDFPTRLVAKMPRAVGPLPHLAAFDLTLRRLFSHAGQTHSYVNASCPVPKSLTAGFIIARAIYDFDDGRRLGVESVRSCRAR